MTDRFEKFIDKANVGKFIWRSGTIVILKSRAKKLIKDQDKAKEKEA